MSRLPDKQATARILCEQQRISVKELPSGAVHFLGHGIDFKVPSWADLNMSDLRPPCMHVESKRQARYGLA